MSETLERPRQFRAWAAYAAADTVNLRPPDLTAELFGDSGVRKAFPDHPFVERHAVDVHEVRIDRQAKSACGLLERLDADVHTGRMSKPRHFIREWRKHRKLTLEQLADKIGMTHQNLGKIERFKVPYNETLLGLLAKALATEPEMLISQDPNKLPSSLLRLWDDIPEDRHGEVMEVLRVFAHPKTHR